MTQFKEKLLGKYPEIKLINNGEIAIAVNIIASPIRNNGNNTVIIGNYFITRP